MAERVLRLRWAGACRVCGAELAAGSEVTWDRIAKAATCVVCRPIDLPAAETTTAVPATSSAVDTGVAGASARREYERRRLRELRRQEAAVAQDVEWRDRTVSAHPVLGRIVTAMTPKPVIRGESQDTRAWADGAAGEEAVGRVLDQVPGIVALHDRRVPRSRANIDHIVVSPSGIYVIDPKNYEGLVERRVAGGLFSRDERLFVNGRDRTRLIDGVVRQVEVVRAAIGQADMPTFPVLCFVGSNWRRFFARPLTVRGVRVVWTAKVVDLVEQPGDFGACVQETAALIASKLPPA